MKWRKAIGKRLTAEYTDKKKRGKKVFSKNFHGDLTEI